MAQNGASRVTIGILALQGAFIEHQSILENLTLERKLVIILVRTEADLSQCDALIIPGGESTTISLLARLSNLLTPLRTFTHHKPTWGTCAGAILLSHSVSGAKKGGQDLLGGMGVRIARNGWGSQVESFEADLSLDLVGLREPGRPFRGVFIRAPVVLELTEEVQVLARLDPELVPKLEGGGEEKTYVALRQGNHLLTTFHPELTDDERFHEYFVRECVFPVVK